MTKENTLIEELKRRCKFSLLKEYHAEVDPVWEEYTGEDWSEVLEVIDQIVDKYYDLLGMESPKV